MNKRCLLFAKFAGYGCARIPPPGPVRHIASPVASNSGCYCVFDRSSSRPDQIIQLRRTQQIGHRRISKMAGSPWLRIWGGIVSHQHLLWPLLIISALGVAQQFVAWYIVWGIFASIVGLYVMSRKKATVASVEAIQQSAADAERELLEEEAAEERERREAYRKANPVAKPKKSPAPSSGSEKKEKPTKVAAEDDVGIHHLAAFARQNIKGKVLASPPPPEPVSGSGSKKAKAAAASAAAAAASASSGGEGSGTPSSGGGSRRRRQDAGGAEADGEGWKLS